MNAAGGRGGGALFRPLSKQAFTAAAHPVRAGCTPPVVPGSAASLLAGSKIASGRGWRVIVPPAEPSPEPACSPRPETEPAFSTWYSRPWATRLCCPWKGVHPDQGHACVNTGRESVFLGHLFHTGGSRAGPEGRGRHPVDTAARRWGHVEQAPGACPGLGPSGQRRPHRGL